MQHSGRGRISISHQGPMTKDKEVHKGQREKTTRQNTARGQEPVSGQGGGRPDQPQADSPRASRLAMIRASRCSAAAKGSGLIRKQAPTRSAGPGQGLGQQLPAVHGSSEATVLMTKKTGQPAGDIPVSQAVNNGKQLFERSPGPLFRRPLTKDGPDMTVV